MNEDVFQTTSATVEKFLRTSSRGLSIELLANFVGVSTLYIERVLFDMLRRGRAYRSSSGNFCAGRALASSSDLLMTMLFFGIQPLTKVTSTLGMSSCAVKCMISESDLVHTVTVNGEEHAVGPVLAMHIYGQILSQPRTVEELAERFGVESRPIRNCLQVLTMEKKITFDSADNLWKVYSAEVGFRGISGLTMVGTPPQSPLRGTEVCYNRIKL